MNDLFAQFEAWYSTRCEAGAGNHHGVSLHNVAEGGWWIRIDLSADEIDRFRSVLQPKEGSPDENPTGWIDYSLKDGAFIGGCAPNLLRELLSVFLSTAHACERNVA
jgi:hypothetical protein